MILEFDGRDYPLMEWARLQAPIAGVLSAHGSDTDDECWRRPVRLEITAERVANYYTAGVMAAHDRIMCRVYLADPRCTVMQISDPKWCTGIPPCECDCLAERRLA
jgi:hypothetical protein